MVQRWNNKLVRCPLYGFAELTSLENRLLSTIAMQRLSRIKQLAHTYLVYPSAVHTRLEHSIGALCLAGRVCSRLSLSKQQTKIIRIAALLHDIGHGPFSHVWETPMRWINNDTFSHETVTKLIIENDIELRKILKSLRKDVVNVLNGNSLSSDIISGSLDVDKLDYLRRDSYHTGVSYGHFDLERILYNLCRISEMGNEYLAIAEKGKDALECYRLARYAMHVQVYGHHTRIIADNMFLRAVKLGLDEECISRTSFDTSDPNFVENYLKYDDSLIQLEILQNSTGLAREFIQNIRNRRLLKRAISVPFARVDSPIIRKNLLEMGNHEIEKMEEEIANEVKTNPAYIILYLQSIRVKLYEPFEQLIGLKEKPFLIKRKDGSVYSLEDESPISVPKPLINKLYVFCPKTKVKKTVSVVKELLGLTS